MGQAGIISAWEGRRRESASVVQLENTILDSNALVLHAALSTLVFQDMSMVNHI